jgi:hypothetical protein
MRASSLVAPFEIKLFLLKNSYSSRRATLRHDRAAKEATGGENERVAGRTFSTIMSNTVLISQGTLDNIDKIAHLADALSENLRKVNRTLER